MISLNEIQTHIKIKLMTCYIIQCKYLNGNQNANHLFSDQWFTILEFYSFFFFQSGLRDYILKARTLNSIIAEKSLPDNKSTYPLFLSAQVK